MKQDNMPQVATFWNNIAHDFDAIYSGRIRLGLAVRSTAPLRKDIYQRFDWVMERSGNVNGIRLSVISGAVPAGSWPSLPAAELRTSWASMWLPRCS